MTTTPPRSAEVAHALRLEYLTVGWKALEAIVGVSAAWRSRSVALMAFGLDGLVECASAIILIWRLRGERRSGDAAHVERVDRRAARLVSASLFVLAAYVTANAVHLLLERERGEASLLGAAVTSASLALMWWLARAKRTAARRLSSAALAADAMQTLACAGLSLLALAGMGLNAAAGWWWADPVAALLMTHFMVQAALAVWRTAARAETSPMGGAHT